MIPYWSTFIKSCLSVGFRAFSFFDTWFEIIDTCIKVKMSAININLMSLRDGFSLSLTKINISYLDKNLRGDCKQNNVCIVDEGWVVVPVKARMIHQPNKA